MAGAALRDGTEIEVREIRPEDREALADAFARLSPESRYRRFFRPLARLSENDLRYQTDVDHDNHEALVGFAPEGELVGVARYIRSEDDPAYAEVAVTVVDQWHGRGVATTLLRRLVVRARANGITHFIALVLGENRDALDLFRSLAVNDPPPRRRGGHIELLIELPEDQVSGSPLGRALRLAAAGSVEFNPMRTLKRALSDARDGRRA